MALNIFAWCWGEKYGHDYVARLAAGLRRHLSEPFRIILVSEWVFHVDGLECVPIPDPHLTKPKGCFARLRMFDPAWQRAVGVGAGDRLACVDLDVIATGALDPIFHRAEPFMILTGANAANPCPYNGSVFLFRAGYRPDVWSDFSLDAASKVPFYSFPDDQAWLAHKLPGVTGWKIGPQSGIYAFKKPQWPKGDDLPAGARMVVFPGHRDPSQFTHLPWVQKHWQ